MSGPAARRRALSELIAASHLMTLEQVPGVLTDIAARAGWSEILIYLADLQENVLYLLAGEGMEAGGAGAANRPAELRVDGTLAGRAFQTGKIVAAGAGTTGEWWVPLLDGTERIGVLRATAEGDAPESAAPSAGAPAPDPDPGPDPDPDPGPDADPDADSVEDIRVLAGLIALVLVSKRGTSDSYARLVRRRGMNVAAEMEWRLMPPRTFASDRMLISAVMEPAYEVSGDAYDYGIADHKVHLSLFDAMGHDTAAGLTANLAVAACRNHRRQHSGLLETAAAIEQALTEQFGGSRYATGILAELDLTTGDLSWLSLGHHQPVIVRDGRTPVSLECPPAPPLGIDLGLTADVCHDQLQPGDRLVLYTDGITEARNPEGREFGLERFTDFLIRHHADGLPVPEMLRRLIRHHLDYHRGKLNDDATVLLLEWHGPTPYRPPHVETLAGLPESTAPPEVLEPAWHTPPEDRTP